MLVLLDTTREEGRHYSYQMIVLKRSTIMCEETCFDCYNAILFYDAEIEIQDCPKGHEHYGMKCIVHNWSIGGDHWYSRKVIKDCKNCPDFQPAE